MNTYKIYFSYFSHTVNVDDIDGERIENGDIQLLFDIAMDDMLSTGTIEVSLAINDAGDAINGYGEIVNDDEYVICGNDCLPLYHGGNLHYTKL